MVRGVAVVVGVVRAGSGGTAGTSGRRNRRVRMELDVVVSMCTNSDDGPVFDHNFVLGS